MFDPEFYPTPTNLVFDRINRNLTINKIIMTILEKIIDSLFFNKITHKVFWCFYVYIKYLDITKNPAPELHKCCICWKEKIIYNK